MSTQTITSDNATDDGAYASSTHTVAPPGVTLTVTGRPGDWTVWSTDEGGELRFAGESGREHASVAANAVYEHIVDARIRAAGLEEMARADRAAAAELAARKETTQALWDALRARAVPATETARATAQNTRSGRRRGKRGGRKHRGNRAAPTAKPATTVQATPSTQTAGSAETATATKPRRRRRARKPAQQQEATTSTTPTTSNAATTTTTTPTPGRAARRRRKGRGAAAVTSTASTAQTATAQAPTSALEAAVAAPTAPTRSTRVTEAHAPTVPDAGVKTSGDDEVSEVRWAVYAQVDGHDGRPPRLVGEVGLLGDALSSVLRGLLGDREAGRVRKTLRAGGLISGPTVYQAPAPRALRVAAAPLDGADAAMLLATRPAARGEQIKTVVDAKTAKTKARPLASR
jgi:hypothetical protein